jgi:hypothetical protein
MFKGSNPAPSESGREKTAKSRNIFYLFKRSFLRGTFAVENSRNNYFNVL